MRYLYSMYFALNVVTGVGYGDMYATTNTERITTCLLIIMGDALFAVAFGLIASIAASKESTFKRYLSTTRDIKRFIGSTSINNGTKDKIE